MNSISGASDHDAERVQRHAERPGFRITELRMSPTQHVPWHCHTNVQDTFYVLAGRVRVTLREPRTGSSPWGLRALQGATRARIPAPTRTQDATPAPRADPVFATPATQRAFDPRGATAVGVKPCFPFTARTRYRSWPEGPLARLDWATGLLADIGSDLYLARSTARNVPAEPSALLAAQPESAAKPR